MVVSLLTLYRILEVDVVPVEVCPVQQYVDPPHFWVRWEQGIYIIT